MRNLSIASRMLLIAFIPALLVALLLSLYSIVYSVRDSEIAELQRASTMAEGLANASEFGVATNNTALLDDIAQPVLSVSSIHSVHYFGPENEPLHQSKDDDYSTAKIGPTALIFRSWISDHPLFNNISAPIIRTDLRQYDDPLFDDGNAEPLSASIGRKLGRVELSVDLSMAYEKQIKSIRRVLLYVGIVLAIALAAAWRLAKSVITPIRSLTTSVRALATHDYIQVPVVPLGGELDELAHGVNYLSSEMESYHASQSEAISLATQDLHNTLSLLEQKNVELDAACESAEAASAFKSQFVANMSHEIRTPLNAIIGTLSVMSKAGLDLTQLDQLDIINKSSGTLLYLVEDILDISKIESGNLVVESINTDIESLLNDLAMTASMQAVDRGIELYVSPIPDTSLRNVYTDPVRLKQVLSNLLSNAIKFTHKGHVSLITEMVEAEPGLRTIKFVVEDTGIGIPVEKQGGLFSAFTQVDMSTTRKFGGTGLGLFICGGIVELLDGTITLTSKVDAGTRLEVVIPMRVANTATVRNPVVSKFNSALQYHDSYLPLKNHNHCLLQTVFCDISTKQEIPESTLISVHNIPNRFLASSWIGSFESIRILDDDLQSISAETEVLTNRIDIALVSQMTPTIKNRLQEAGYAGYLIKTPSLILLKRYLQQAISHQSFQLHPDSASPDERPESIGRQLTVLAIDDQRINIDLLMQYFDHLDIRGIYASSGLEGLDYINSEPVDLVLLDLHMPVHDGFYVVEKIRNSGSVNAQVPVIAMTADAYSSTRERAMATGFDSVLTKPATLHHVSSVINEWTRTVGVDGVPSSPLIDVKACAEAIRGNEDWVRGALQTYADEVPGHIQAIKHALLIKGRRELFEVAHAVKGVSRLFQINLVADCAEVLEASSSSAEWKLLESQSRRLIDVLHSAEAECKSIKA